MADTMKGLKRTHYCGTVTPEMIGREVVVCGWAQKTRDMGTLVFIDLRDRTGIVQLIFDDSTDRAVMEKAKDVRSEYVLMAKGTVRRRESVNPDLPTGEVEIFVTELRILAAIRLGITDSGHIASLLNCASATVYTYRTKLRNAALDRDNFEQQVSRIGL